PVSHHLPPTSRLRKLRRLRWGTKPRYPFVPRSEARGEGAPAKRGRGQPAGPGKPVSHHLPPTSRPPEPTTHHSIPSNPKRANPSPTRPPPAFDLGLRCAGGSRCAWRFRPPLRH